MSMTDSASAGPAELTCERCRELLSDYIDRELTAAELASVEHHVSTCGKCQTESTRLGGLKKVIQHWDGVKGSANFRKAVMDQMIRESQMLSSGPLVQAADAARAQPQPAPRLPAGWILFGAALLGLLLYWAISMLRG